MTNEEMRADLIEVLEKGTFNTEHTFMTSSGMLGVLNLKSGRTEGIFQGADGSNLLFKKTSFWKSNFDLRQGGMILSTAAPRGRLSRALRIDFDSMEYGLHPGGSKLRSWVIKDCQDQVICELDPRGLLKRGALIRIIQEVPLPLVVFAYCLVSRRWQEQSSS